MLPLSARQHPTIQLGRGVALDVAGMATGISRPRSLVKTTTLRSARRLGILSGIAIGLRNPE